MKFYKFWNQNAQDITFSFSTDMIFSDSVLPTEEQQQQQHFISVEKFMFWNKSEYEVSEVSYLQLRKALSCL